MKKNVIITIGRQFCSGGAEIGAKLSEALGIAYYDKELLVEAAKQSGLCEEMFEKADEQAIVSFSYAMPMAYSFWGGYLPCTNVMSQDDCFRYQSDTIRSIAEKESCVLMGRCADYVLREMPNCISFFIHNSKEVRIQRALKNFDWSVEQAEEMIEKADKQRASYYDFYTNKEWGKASSYHYCLDVSVLGVEGTVSMMVNMIQAILHNA